jgi:tetratricopeptide (TPR) repeat protein
VVLFKGIIRISDSLYNKGLSLARNFDLTGAIENLTKSVEINKNHIQARNLLGLALFEVGHVADALKHWVISHSLLPNGNPAAKYIKTAQDSGRHLERLNDAIGMYNQSLEYIRQKSDDLAIIQLKKAIEINPKFIDAINLLALCYLIQDDQDKAGRTIDKVLSLDVHNTIALNYYAALHPQRIREPRIRKPGQGPQPSVTNQPPPQSFQRIPAHDKKPTNFHIAEILSFIIGAACAFAALYVLVFPAIERENERKLDEMQNRMTENAMVYQEKIERYIHDLNTNEERINDHKNDIADLEERLDIQERTNRVLTAYNILADQRMQDAVDMADGLDTTGLAFDIVEKAAIIYEIAYPLLAKQYYDDGVAAHDQNDHAKAMVDFEKSLRYAADDASYLPDVLLNLAHIYYQDFPGDKERLVAAMEYLTILKEDYPNFSTQNVNRYFTDIGAALAVFGG